MTSIFGFAGLVRSAFTTGVSQPTGFLLLDLPIDAIVSLLSGVVPFAWLYWGLMLIQKRVERMKRRIQTNHSPIARAIAIRLGILGGAYGLLALAGWPLLFGVLIIILGPLAVFAAVDLMR